MKTCSKCKEEKSLDQFNRHRRNGRQAYCRACQKIHSASDKGKANKARYKASDKGKIVLARHNQTRRRRYPEKYQAKDAVSHAIRDGKLPPAATHTCEVCGAPACDYHHEAYERPLDVIPLCRPCHIGVHKNGKE